MDKIVDRCALTIYPYSLGIIFHTHNKMIQFYLKMMQIRYLPSYMLNKNCNLLEHHSIHSLKCNVVYTIQLELMLPS